MNAVMRQISGATLGILNSVKQNVRNIPGGQPGTGPLRPAAIALDPATIYTH